MCENKCSYMCAGARSAVGVGRCTKTFVRICVWGGSVYASQFYPTLVHYEKKGDE